MSLTDNLPRAIIILIMASWIFVGAQEYLLKMDQRSLALFLKNTPQSNELEAGDEFMQVLTRMSRSTSPERIAITKNEGETDAEFSYHYYWTTFVFPSTYVVPYANKSHAFNAREPFIYTQHEYEAENYVVSQFGSFKVYQSTK